jgi:4-amino-4-deoxy-L-arabinose transferase-like glycosyltransferase
MKKTELPKIYWMPILAVAAAKLILHLVFIQNYGFHRDELLYMALGQHPAFGYWSNPPLLGWLSALVQNTLGGHLWSLRLVPALVMSGVVILTGLMAREMKGGRYAQFLAAFIAFFSPAFLRIGHMFMPVSIDIAFWTLYCWLLLRYLNTENLKYILYFGAAFGLGMLNKYSVGFFMVPLVVVLLFSRHRNLLWKRQTGLAALLALGSISSQSDLAGCQ